MSYRLIRRKTRTKISKGGATKSIKKTNLKSKNNLRHISGFNGKLLKRLSGKKKVSRKKK